LPGLNGGEAAAVVHPSHVPESLCPGIVMRNACMKLNKKNFFTRLTDTRASSCTRRLAQVSGASFLRVCHRFKLRRKLERV